MPTMFRVWNVDTRVMMLNYILTEAFLIDDDRDEAQDDTGMTVVVPLLVTVVSWLFGVMAESFLNKRKLTDLLCMFCICRLETTRPGVDKVKPKGWFKYS